MDIYDLAVVGAGASGTMAAIRASQLKKNVALIEKNKTIGRKILLTGGGRCNLTNAAAIDRFIEAFAKQGNFLRSAFQAFDNRALMNFFERRGLVLKVERQGRVFPVTDQASSVVKILQECLLENKVKLLFGQRLEGIEKKDGIFQLKTQEYHKIYAQKVILACGGASFKVTGSSGDGYYIAKQLGHTITPLTAALVPLRTSESWVKQLQGLSLKNIRLFFFTTDDAGHQARKDKIKITSEIGEIVFTHFGISGPLVLDLSGRIALALTLHSQVHLLIDLKPALTAEQLEQRLLKELNSQQNTQLKNMLRSLMPQSLIPVFLRLAKLIPEKKMNQLTRNERQVIIKLLKALPLSVIGTLPIEEAMVTCGGVSTREISPRTMESKIVPGLYFSGEIIQGCACSGGYNLQQAFSTGYLAGESAANA